MSEVPQFVIKTLLCSFSVKKLSEYRAKFKLLFHEIDPIYDEILGQFEDFYKTYDTVLTEEILLDQLELAGHSKEAQYFRTLMEDPLVAVYEGEADFFNALEQAETEKTLNELFKAQQTFQLELSDRKQLGLLGIVAPIETFLTTAHALKSRSSRSETSTSSYLYEDEVQGQGTSLKEIYQEIKSKADTGDAQYFNCGLKGFDDALFKDGDLIFYGGYTSQGKSVLLRHNAYRQITHYGRNVAFFTKEMTHRDVRIFFASLHANNKQRFPGTPYIEVKKVLEGRLSPEEEDFYFNYADRDLLCNENYGTLYLDQPNKSRYRMSDLTAQLDEIEATKMPVECLAYDYLMLMYPVESDKITPQRQDYNEMVKEFKNLLMTHRNIKGHVTPILGFTAAKISRGALKECEKNNGVYELSAFSDYSEIEFSADHVFTVYMTTEMKNINQIRIQHLKNRNGPVVPEPYDAFINLKHGLSVHDTNERSEQEVRQILTGLQLG